MSTSIFSVTEHLIPCQHIREYPKAIISEPAALRLAIKEYRPLDNFDAAPGSVTVIAAHANGFPKETYEPLWDGLHRAFKGKIRAIWIADCSHQGASGVLNENIQGDEPNWFDHSRDLLRMVNHFEERMLRPIIGIAHSMGAAQLVQLSLIHPRLFHSLALIEPVIQDSAPAGPNAALFSSFRPDIWPSRHAAEESLRKNKVFKSWEPCALEKYLQYGLRKTPTALYPTVSEPGSVTLTTTKHQEAWSYVRSNFVSMANNDQARLVSLDLDEEKRKYLFHAPQTVQALASLPSVRPNVLWIFGESSPINTPALQDEKMTRTGVGVGGSGGSKAGRVEKEVVVKAGHMLPFEKIEVCATLLAAWLERQIQDYDSLEQFYQEHSSGRSERDMLVLSTLWSEKVRLPPREKRADKPKL